MKINITFIVASIIIVIDAIGINAVKEDPVGFVAVIGVFALGNMAVDTLLEILISHFNIDMSIKDYIGIDILGEERYIFHAISAGLTFFLLFQVNNLL